MARLHDKNNFIWLTFALIGLLVVGAWSRDAPDSLTAMLIEFTVTGLLMFSLMSLRSRSHWTRWLIAIIGLMLIMSISGDATGLYHFDMIYLGLLLTFLLGAAWLVAGHVLLTGSVDLNKMVGAVALYMILGLVWSVLYTIVLEVWPDSFAGIEAGPWHENLPSTTYFSFVTLTTLGYGDISPVRPMAEVLVVLEAIAGMFYLAIIVASLVGAIRITHSEK